MSGNLKVVSHDYIFADERPFASCHASTLVTLPGGTILAAWFGGTAEGADDVAIWISRCDHGVWSDPVKVADREGIPHWNPVLYRDDQGLIHLYYKIGHKIPTWETMVITSADGGLTWSEPRLLVPGDQGGRGPVKNKPILLHNGALAAPASIENEYWDAFVDLSRDGGLSWEQSALVPIENRVVEAYAKDAPPVPAGSFRGKGVIQPTLWESVPGTVHMLLRSTDGYIYRSDSEDGGLTWTTAYSIGLPNNNSGIDLASFGGGQLALVYNPVEGNWGARSPLVVEFSKDNGQTWGDRFVLEEQPGEYSYPAIVADENGLHITYTWKRERIVYWHISVSS